MDGGGCGNAVSPPIGNTDTRNCSTAVPAVIVAVTDNGASTDAASLAHNTALLSETNINLLITTNQHRKIRDYTLVDDVGILGTTCDSILTGGQTHGNVVAGTILGNASALGFQFSMNAEAGNPGDRKRVNLDGTARNARLVMQDAGNANAVHHRRDRGAGRERQPRLADDPDDQCLRPRRPAARLPLRDSELDRRREPLPPASTRPTRSPSTRTW